MRDKIERAVEITKELTNSLLNVAGENRGEKVIATMKGRNRVTKAVVRVLLPQVMLEPFETGMDASEEFYTTLIRKESQKGGLKGYFAIERISFRATLHPEVAYSIGADAWMARIPEFTQQQLQEMDTAWNNILDRFNLTRTISKLAITDPVPHIPVPHLTIVKNY